MTRLFQRLLGGLWWVLNFRLLRLLAVIGLIFWGFDSVVTFCTDAAWFSSLGLGATFWHTRLLQLELFTAFFVACLAFAIPFLRVSAKPIDAPQGAASFPRALDFLGHWYGLAPKLSWLVVLVAAFLCAHSLGANWQYFEELCYALKFGDSLSVFDEAFWWSAFPFFSLLLGLVWKFSIVLLLVVALAGGVRALPFLATRDPIQPKKWLRVLVILGCITLGLRAFGYLKQILSLLFGSELTGFETFVKAPVFVFGIGLCVLAILGVLRGAKRRTLLFSIGAALIAPFAINIALAPFLFWLPAPKINERYGTRAFEAPPQKPSAGSTLSLEKSWPVWDEWHVLQVADAARNANQSNDNQNQALTEWKSAALFQDKDKNWRAGIVGKKVPDAPGNSSVFADAENAQTWAIFDLDQTREGLPVKDDRFSPAGKAFYGLQNEPLFSNDPKQGVSFQGLNTVLWSLRLKSPFLALQSAGRKRVLPYLGLQQTVQYVAPMFLWDEARPLWKDGQWLWVCDGYSVSSDFPNVDAIDGGFFAGYNYARLSVRVIQNPETGALTLVPVQTNNVKNYTDPLLKVWLRALPKLFSVEPQGLNFGSKLSQIEALTSSGEAIWTNGPRLTTTGAMSNDKIKSELVELDNEVQKPFGVTETRQLESGVPIAWQDGENWWIGRAYFEVARNSTTGQKQGVKLYKIGLTQMGSALYGFGDSISNARLNHTLKVQARKAATMPSRTDEIPLEIRALQAHQRAEDAVKKRDWVVRDREAASERRLLEELVKRRTTP